MSHIFASFFFIAIWLFESGLRASFWESQICHFFRMTLSPSHSTPNLQAQPLISWCSISEAGQRLRSPPNRLVVGHLRLTLLLTPVRHNPVQAVRFDIKCQYVLCSYIVISSKRATNCDTHSSCFCLLMQLAEFQCSWRLFRHANLMLHLSSLWVITRRLVNI